ncbi:MAG: ribbon-helix-helix protein, CopG family [Acidobacteria bacterium]|nr:ribbon-helix-helix protein, CopG family [Acidobacteriota bacterium]
MNVDKVTISIDADILKKLDRMVRAKVFPNRSRAIQDAVSEKLNRIDKSRLDRELDKLTKADVKIEKALADEGLASEVDQWPPY